MTTITTEMLKFMAHTLGLQIDTVRAFARRNGVTIDDTPADTDAEEQGMSEWSHETVEQIDDTVARLNCAPDTEEQTMAMTITQEQFETAFRAYNDGPLDVRDSIALALATLGITITPAEPPEAMVKLAREIVAVCYEKWDEPRLAAAIREGERDKGVDVQVALATLQHAVDVVKGAPDYANPDAVRKKILVALGAGGRDAG